MHSSFDERGSGAGPATETGVPVLPTVSVVICAYTMDRWDLLREAVESVRRQSVPALETLLVVDHSPALLSAALAEFSADVTVLANTEKQGLSGARNSGVAAARGDVVAFLDDDAAAEPGWLAALAAPYADPSVMGVGGYVEPRWATARPAWFPREFGWIVGCSYEGQPRSRAAVRNPIGANMSFRRQAMVAVGGFSHAVGRVGTRPVGCEETELSIRVARWAPDSSIQLEPQARVRHWVPGERATWTYFRRRCWAEGLSKAAVSRLTDPRAALSAERSYVRHALPRGAVAGLRDVTRAGEPGGLGRAMSIVAGLGITATGYLAGRVATSRPTTKTLQREDAS